MRMPTTLRETRELRTPRDLLRLSWILACALCWAPAPIAAEQPPSAGSATILEAAIRSPLERSGDNDALAGAWLDAIAAHPEDYRCELLARRLTAIRPTLRSEVALAPRLEELLRRPQPPTGLVRQILIDNLVDLCRLQGREEEAHGTSHT